MKKGSANGLLLLALLAAVFLATQISFAQTAPQCYLLGTSMVCDSNIVPVTTQPGGTGTGTINMIVRVGGTAINVAQNNSCTAHLVTPSGNNTGGCARDPIQNAVAGNYSVVWISGWPQGANQTQNPSVSGPQTLTAGGTINFYIDFAAAGPTPYSISCNPVGTNAISVPWYGNIPGTLTLYGNDTYNICDQNPSECRPLNTVASVGDGSFTETGLSEGKTRYYRLKTVKNSDGSVIWSNGPVSCKTGTTVKDIDIPTNLDIKAVNENTLNLTWTDNVKTNRGHRFEVQRIKATPKPSYDFLSVSKTSASVSFSWKNMTGYAPYNSVLERSTSPNAGTRFSKSDASMATLTSNEYDSYANGNTNGSSIAKSFAYTDLGLGEATVYYYQLKACFPDAVTALYTPVRPGETVNPRPDKACSAYVPGGTSALATTTLPIAPSNLTASVISPSGITVTFKDNSAKEQGFRIYRDGVSVATLGASAATGVTLTFNDSGLNSGTTYAYTVKSFITDPLTGTELVSAVSNSASATTWVTLTVTASPSAGGRITGTGISCGNGGTSCSNDFEKGYPVALTASPASSYDFTKWTGGACNNSVSASCSFTINSDVSVTANFTYVPPAPTDLCSNVTGVQTTTPCADTLCVAPATWNVLTQTCVRPPLGDNSGDVNGDGLITCADVNLINQFVANGNTGLSATQQKWADVSKNGSVSAYDAALLNLSCPAASAAPVDVATADLSSAVSVAKDTVSGWWNGLVSAFKSGWNVVAGLFNSIGVKEAEAVTDGAYENYFKQSIFSADLSSRLLDTGLDKDSVYIYRVRVVYTGGSGPSTSDWSDKAAGKTLGAGGAVLCPDGVTPPPCPNDGGAPVIYSGLTASGKVGQSFSYSILANNNPTSYSASGLPGGLSINTSTGVIAGTPSTAGISSVSIGASNAKGTDTKTLRMVILTSGGGGGVPGPDGGGGGGVGICAANNLCDFSISSVQILDGKGLLLEQSEIQCVVNADCADVGRYSKTFEEQ